MENMEKGSHIQKRDNSVNDGDPKHSFKTSAFEDGTVRQEGNWESPSNFNPYNIDPERNSGHDIQL